MRSNANLWNVYVTEDGKYTTVTYAVIAPRKYTSSMVREEVEPLLEEGEELSNEDPRLMMGCVKL